MATPLPGSCAALSLPAAATDTVTSGQPSETNGPGLGGWNSTGSVCPLKGCSKGVDRAAQLIIETLDDITIAAYRLQLGAEKLGGRGNRLEVGAEGVQLAEADQFDPIYGRSLT